MLNALKGKRKIRSCYALLSIKKVQFTILVVLGEKNPQYIV